MVATGKNNKMRSWTVSCLSLKTKVESGLRGGQVMSRDWREATPSMRGFQWLTTKPLGYLDEPQSQDRRPKCARLQHKADLTGGSGRWGPVWPVCFVTASGDFEEEDTRRDHKACAEAKEVVIAGHPYDGAMTKIPKVLLGGVYLSIMY
jgi:hypothetical protein